MQRVLEPETLDHLAPDDPAAVRSRRDLYRVNRFMGATGILVGAIDRTLARGTATDRPLRVLEIGSGDGRLMLDVARALRRRWPHAELTLLDRQPIVDEATIAAFDLLGWWALPLTADVVAWADTPPPRMPYDLVVANLFLHHFDAEPLVRLLAAIARCSTAFVACEPKRGPLALASSHLVFALGANAVTRRDAVLSVRAGFRGAELSSLWPGGGEWTLAERGAGVFSHLFCASRASTPA